MGSVCRKNKHNENLWSEKKPMERGYLEDRSVDDKRIFKEYGGRRGPGSFASNRDRWLLFLKKK